MSIDLLINKYYNQYFFHEEESINFLLETVKTTNNILQIGKDNEDCIKKIQSLNFKLDSIEIKDYTKKSKTNKYYEIFILSDEFETLLNLVEYKKVLIKIYNDLQDGGYFILESKNFDKMIWNKSLDLPSIITKIDDVEIKIEKQYSTNKENDIIIINNNIYDKQNAILFDSKDIINNYINSKELVDLLKEIGFLDIEIYESFDQKDYKRESSYSFVIRARKTYNLLKKSEEYEEYSKNVVNINKKCCKKGGSGGGCSKCTGCSGCNRIK